MIEVRLDVGVEQREVPLAAAPEHEVLRPESVGDLQPLLDLGARVGRHVGVAAGGGAVHVPGANERVGLLSIWFCLFLLTDLRVRFRIDTMVFVNNWVEVQ